MWVYILLIVFATFYAIIDLDRDKYSSLLVFLPVSFIVILQSDLLAALGLSLASFMIGVRTGVRMIAKIEKVDAMKHKE